MGGCAFVRLSRRAEHGDVTEHDGEGDQRHGEGDPRCWRKITPQRFATSRIEPDGVTALEVAAKAHQDRPFVDLVAPLVPAAQRLAYGMLQNPHEAEDAV